ncbi:MAG: Mut7-C ubiquitin/RNAse domain-containing protein [Verrucomicrobia bacterium]|nr:Mut7-C ubiquitin/RNAse domain-containing protein [Prolixibacteraceae bacterium]
MNHVSMRFYEELNDYLPGSMRQAWVDNQVETQTSVGEKIQSLGIPLDKIDLILVNEHSKDFDYQLQDGDRVSVYPVFESFDISDIIQVREKPLRDPKFICDVQLGRLCKYLRMLGWDTHYSNLYTPEDLIELSLEEKRIILTRNVRLARDKQVTHALWIRSSDALEQLKEVMNKLHLSEQADPLTRCLVCNGILVPVDKQDILHRLEPRTAKYYTEYFHCLTCDQIYWKGSHYENMLKFIQLNIQKQLTS